MKPPQTFVPKSFTIPKKARALIEKWQLSLPPSDWINWTERFTFSFTDNGMATFIGVSDSVSGQRFDWCNNVENW